MGGQVVGRSLLSALFDRLDFASRLLFYSSVLRGPLLFFFVVGVVFSTKADIDTGLKISDPLLTVCAGPGAVSRRSAFVSSKSWCSQVLCSLSLCSQLPRTSV